MPYKIIAKIRERLNEYFTTKEEFDALLPSKAEEEDIPTMMGDLTNDSDFIEQFYVTEIKDTLNALTAEFDSTTGVLRIYEREYILSVESSTITTTKHDITINANLSLNGLPIPNKTINLYIGDTLITSRITNSEGNVSLETRVSETTTTFTVEFNNLTETVVVTYQTTTTYYYPFNGTETFKTVQGTLSTSGGVFYGGYGWISNFAWSNDRNWELRAEVRIHDDTSVALYDSECTPAHDHFKTYIRQNKNGLVFFVGAGYQRIEHQYTELQIEDNILRPIIIKKIDDTTLEITAITSTVRISNDYFFTFYDICLGSHKNYGCQIKNASVTFDIPFDFSTLITSYSPELTGSESITTISDTLTIENNMLIGRGSGYLSDGFSNTEFWEISFKMKVDNPYLRVFKVCLFNEDSTTVSQNILTIDGLLDFETYTEGSKFVMLWRDGDSSYHQSFDDFVQIKIRRISEKTISVKIGDLPYKKMLWKGLPTYETLCIGISTDSRAYVYLKDIVAKIMED